MEMVLVTKLAIAVIVQATHHDAAACTAGSGGRKCVAEDDTVSGNGVNCRCFRNGIPVTTQSRTLIVGDDKQHIPLGSVEGGLKDTPRQAQSEQWESQTVA